MKTVSQEEFFDIELYVGEFGSVNLSQIDCANKRHSLSVDKVGAKQLIEFLNDFISNQLDSD